MPTPSYLALYQSGELALRAERLHARMFSCDLCPRACGVDRLEGELGTCKSGALPLLASFCAHHGEEPALSGTRGSGTIFFASCNLRCAFCQNYQISQSPAARREVSVKELADAMLALQSQGCHNINLVSPSHQVAQIMSALVIAAGRGLRLPLVYNSNAYDSLATLCELDGVVDIYLPDLKYASDEAALRYSQAPRYVAIARAAIKEMFRQVGELVLDEEGLARRGLIVRHLILPHGLAGTRESLRWLAGEVSRRVTLSLMAQYHPAHRAAKYPELARRITEAEYDEAMQALTDSGLENGWAQGREAHAHYLPDFAREGHPFEPAG